MTDSSHLRLLPSRALLMLAACTTLVGVWAGAATLDPPPYLGIELLGSGFIHELDPGGPAAEAGLKVGQRVIAVDGGALHARISMFGKNEESRAIELTVQRSTDTVAVLVTAGTIGTRPHVFNLERLFVGFIFWAVGLAVWIFCTAVPAARIFFLMSQMTAGLMFAEVLDPHIPAMSVVTDLFRYLVAPLVLHFFAIFPSPLPLHVRRPLLRAGYLGYGAITVLTISSLFLKIDVYASGMWAVPRVFEVVVLLVALGVLLRPYESPSLDTRRRRRILLLGMLLGLFPVILTMVGLVLQKPLIPYEFTVPVLALVPLTFAYAVYKGEIARADLILNRSVVYLILSSLLLGLYAILYLGLDIILGTERKWEQIAVGVSLVAVGSAVFVPVRTRLQHWVDRLFYGGWYDYRSFVESVSADLSSSVSLDHLIGQLRAAAETMRFHGGVVLWPGREAFVPRGSFGVSRSLLPRLRISADAEILRYLEETAAPVAHDDLAAALERDALQPEEQDLLEVEEIGYWLPLVCRGTLRSILVTAKRLGDEKLDPQDIAIVTTLSTQAAIACENITLLESLKERLSEVESIRDELAETQGRLSEGREDERLHLSRELHDGPVQDIYTLLHALEATNGRSIALNERELAHVRDTMQRVATTLRDVCIELRPPLLADFGLDVALKSYIARFREKHPETKVAACLDTGVKKLPERVQLALFRICQEALNNAAQHSGANQIEITLTAGQESISLDIVDDGCGFEVPARWIELARAGHLGLLGTAERVESIGGVLSVTSAPGRGTAVSVTAPWPNLPAAETDPLTSRVA